MYREYSVFSFQPRKGSVSCVNSQSIVYNWLLVVIPGSTASVQCLKGCWAKKKVDLNDKIMTKKYFFLMTNVLSSAKVESLKRGVKAFTSSAFES